MLINLFKGNKYKNVFARHLTKMPENPLPQRLPDGEVLAKHLTTHLTTHLTIGVPFSRICRSTYGRLPEQEFGC